jgi:hypothetical protein
MTCETKEELCNDIDYRRALDCIKDLPRYYLGEEVDTIHGRGILVDISMPSNGLYISPEKTECVVWYSTQKSTTFVQAVFSIGDINKIPKEVHDES